MAKYEVPIIYVGLSNFIVEAETEEQAREKARLKFRGGEQPDVLGNEWEEIERIGEIQEVTDAKQD
jgi:hypothetical protein